MNIANKITLLRVVIIPVFVFFMLNNFLIYSKYIALAIFIIASFTDMLDGYLARKYNLVTDFGKFMDPLADKLLVCSALICLVESDLIPSWVVIIIISREFIISGFRLVAANKNVVIAASYWAKVKTATQMIMVGVLILNIDTTLFNNIELVLIYVSLILTIISLIDYIQKNKKVMESTY